mmetsp:Transcript_84569/g.262643  ORF Transcript_84569/g.262643 Transcript_84569/m.262643 type:complete len:208 (+) Transcript_84569:645-1268(+)
MMPAWRAKEVARRPLARVVYRPLSSDSPEPSSSVETGPARKAPARTQGELTKTTGVVPRRIWTRFSFRMPQMTLVGQSGPPRRQETFAFVKPRARRIFSTLRMSGLSTMHSCWTFTDCPRKKPIMYCPAQAMSFRIQDTMQAMTIPHPKPTGVALARAAMTTPAAMYTGTPGTGGRRNMVRPTKKKMMITTPRSTSRSWTFSHDRKT